MDGYLTGATSASELWVCELGLVPYREALELQRQVCERRQREELLDTLLLLEHPPTYTRGRRSAAAELLYDESFYRGRGIEVYETDRGGRVTYHGPGQLVGYPIMRAPDIGAHLRAIESALIAALARTGLKARSRCAEGPDYTGVWVGERKVASIGVHVSRGVTTHGFAVNVENALEPFSWVIACGLEAVQMTSLAAELGADAVPEAAAFRAIVAQEFARAHGRQLQRVAPERLAPAELVA
jgi:lipoyl(octanoyl) transferase